MVSGVWPSKHQVASTKEVSSLKIHNWKISLSWVVILRLQILCSTLPAWMTWQSYVQHIYPEHTSHQTNKKVKEKSYTCKSTHWVYKL